jgi:hypothetical protein
MRFNFRDFGQFTDGWTGDLGLDQARHSRCLAFVELIGGRQGGDFQGFGIGQVVIDVIDELIG